MVLKSFVLYVRGYFKPTKSVSQIVDTALNTTFDLHVGEPVLWGDNTDIFHGLLASLFNRPR